LISRVKSIIIIIIINLDQASPSRPKKLGFGKGHLTQRAWVWLECRPKYLWSCTTLTQDYLVFRHDPRLICSVSRSKTLGSCVRIKFSWARQDPMFLAPASEPKANESCVSTQFSWVRHQDPKFLDHRFLNIIIYIIIKSINIKNIIICVINIIIFIIIKSINIKNSIICVINIIMFIIINIINKIINKFEKTYYQYWKTTIYLIWSVKLKNFHHHHHH